MPTTSDNINEEKEQRFEKCMQIMDILDQLLMLRNEMILWSQQCTAKISLSIVEAVRTNVDVIERFDESGIALIVENISIQS